MTEWQRYKELFTTYRKCIVIGCGLQFFQQFIGINTIMYYGPEIIIQSGATIQGINDEERLGILMNIPLAATNAFGSLIAIFIIDNLGRRFMLLRATPFIMLSLIGIALSMQQIIFSYDEESQNVGRMFFMISITLYLLFFSIGF